MTRAVLSPAAERDILEITEWMAAGNPVAARGFRVTLDKLADTIGEHPRIGPLKPQLAFPPIRFLPIGGLPPTLSSTRRNAIRR